MNIIKSGVIALAMLAAPLTASAATVVLTDDFNGYGDGVNALNVAADFFAPNWTTTPTLDYIVDNAYGNLCRGTGACVDLDGSTLNSGILASVLSFGPGSYSLSYQLFGNGRDGRQTDSVTISLGSESFTISDIAYDADVSGTWVFATSTAGVLSFQNAGGDNVGAVLSSATLSAVPLPAGGLLLFAALGGAAALRRRKAPKAA